MEQLYQKRNHIDTIASKVAIRLLRNFFAWPHRSFGAPELARLLGTSRASVHRQLNPLTDIGILRRIDEGHQAVYRIDASNPMTPPLFELFNHERYLSVPDKVQNAIARLLHTLMKNRLETVVLFGSHARGLASERSDIDICIVWKDDVKRIRRTLGAAWKEYPWIRFDPHQYRIRDLTYVPDLVVLDSLLFGIAVHGPRNLFSARFSLEAIPKTVLLARLDGCRKTLEMASMTEGEGKRLLEDNAEVTLTELESILESGRTLSRKEMVPRSRFTDRIRSLDSMLASRGSRIWLT